MSALLLALALHGDPLVDVMKGSVCAQRGSITRSEVYRAVSRTPMEELQAAQRGNDALEAYIGPVRYAKLEREVMAFSALPTADLIRECHRLFR